jgi:hypothetical protein
LSKYSDSDAVVPVNQLNAKVVLGVFERHAESLSWKFLTAAVGASTPPQIKKLRQVLKGLVRTHELSLVDGHIYQRQQAAQPKDAQSEEVAQGEVSKLDGVMRINGMSVVPPRKGSPVARAGDVVDYQVVEGKVQVVAIVKHSELPVVGRA